MSRIYPAGRQTVKEWGLMNATPAGLSLQVCAVGDSYVYSASHSEYEDLGSTVTGAPESIPNWTYVDGVINGDDVTFTGVVPGSILSALVIFLAWPGNSLLLGYINESVDGTLPAVNLTTQNEVVWNPLGIMKF